MEHSCSFYNLNPMGLGFRVSPVNNGEPNGKKMENEMETGIIYRGL